MVATAQNTSTIRQHDRPHWLALGAIAGPVLFVSTWIILGLVRPGYSIVKQSVSVLGIGKYGAFMNAAFIIGAFLLFAGVGGIIQSTHKDIRPKIRIICAGLLALPAAGMLWAGIFDMKHIVLHNVGAGLAFSAPVVTFAFVGLTLREVPVSRRIGNSLLVASPLTLALLIGFFTSAPLAVLQSLRGGGLLGLWERALIVEVFAWYVLLGWRALRHATAP